MELKDLRRLVAEIQRSQMEPDEVEVKAARGGTPKVLDSLSALANRPGGGVILLGLDDKGFAVVGVGDCQKVQTEVADWARNLLEPPLTLQFTVDEIDGKPVMAIEVPEVPTALKPCYDKNKGLHGNGGAYLRAGGTDRAMTDYEIFGYISSRGQPKSDEDAVPEATLTDLDGSALDGYLAELQRTRPLAFDPLGSRDEQLTRLHVLCRFGDRLCPTLAGLLSFGKYPQEYFPQLRINYVQFYGITEEEPAPGGARFLDNRTFEGSIPAMLEHVEKYILAGLRKASLIDGMFRRDIPEYPQVAIREVLANAMAHRDYSTHVRGTTIDVKLFADRLEVRSPGGLHGNVTLDNLEEEHTTRNARLMRILEDIRVVENRGSGIKAMIGALRAANLEPPTFDDRRASFLVTFRNHTLMNPDGVRWLNQYATRQLNDRQRVALVYLRQNNRIGNADYRRLNRVDPLVAGQELRGLVEEGLLTSEGVGRWTHYRLAVPKGVEETPIPMNDEEKILAYVVEHGSVTNSQCRDLLGVNDERARYLLTGLADANRLRADGKWRWRKYLPL